MPNNDSLQVHWKPKEEMSGEWLLIFKGEKCSKIWLLVEYKHFSKHYPNLFSICIKYISLKIYGRAL